MRVISKARRALLSSPRLKVGAYFRTSSSSPLRSLLIPPQSTNSGPFYLSIDFFLHVFRPWLPQTLSRSRLIHPPAEVVLTTNTSLSPAYINSCCSTLLSPFPFPFPTNPSWLAKISYQNTALMTSPLHLVFSTSVSRKIVLSVHSTLNR